MLVPVDANASILSSRKRSCNKKDDITSILALMGRQLIIKDAIASLMAAPLHDKSTAQIDQPFPSVLTILPQ
jgi:hypothetical protein